MCCRSEAVQRPNFPKLEESGKNGCLPIFFAIGIITMLGSVFILLSSYKVLPYEINAINDLGVKGLLLGYTGCAVGLLVAGVSLSKWCAKESFSQPAESRSSETNIVKTVKIFNFDVNLQQLEEENTSFSTFPHFLDGKALIIGHYNKNFMGMKQEEFRELKKIVTDNKKIYNFDRILLEQLKKNCKHRINIFKVDNLNFERIKIEVQIRSSFVESQSEVGILEGKALINLSKEDIAKESLDSALVVIKNHAIDEIEKSFHVNCRLPAHVQIAFVVTRQINNIEEEDTTLDNVKWINEISRDLSVTPTSKISMESHSENNPVEPSTNNNNTKETAASTEEEKDPLITPASIYGVSSDKYLSYAKEMSISYFAHMRKGVEESKKAEFEDVASKIGDKEVLELYAEKFNELKNSSINGIKNLEIKIENLGLCKTAAEFSFKLHKSEPLRMVKIYIEVRFSMDSNSENVVANFEKRLANKPQVEGGFPGICTVEDLNKHLSGLKTYAIGKLKSQLAAQMGLLPARVEIVLQVTSKDSVSQGDYDKILQTSIINIGWWGSSNTESTYPK